MSINLDLAPRITTQELLDLFALANGKTTLAGLPYTISSDEFYWKHGITDRGGYSAGTTYHPYDMVQHGGFNWIATTTQTGNPPLTSATPPVPNSGWIQPWLSALSRMRANLINGATGYVAASILAAQNKTSGPWPITGVGTTSISGIYADVSIVYPDTGGAETLSLVSLNSANGKILPDSSFSKMHGRIIIGGNQNVTFTGVFACSISRGIDPPFRPLDPPPTSTDTSGVTFQCTSNFPGATGSWTRSGDKFYFEANGVTVAPGVYDFVLVAAGKIICNGSIQLDPYFGDSWGMGAYRSDHNYNSASLGSAKIVTTFSTTTNVVGVHNTKQIKRIQGSVLTTLPYAFGLFVVGDNSILQMNDPAMGGFGDPLYRNTATGIWGSYKENAPNNTWTSTAAGIFFVKTLPISDLKMLVHTSMPWNLFLRPDGTFPSTSDAPPQRLNQPYKVGTSAPYNYTRAYTSPWETQNSPPAWVASTWYDVGFQIQDGNGKIQMVTVGGKSGASAPSWSTSLGGTTGDNAVTWKLVNLPSRSMTPARARMFSPPLYPTIWDSDVWQANTAVALGKKIIDGNGEIRICSLAGVTGSSAPAWGSGGSASIVTPNWGMEGSATEITDGTAKWKPWLAGFNPRGWWIYRVTINRLASPGGVVSAGGGGVGAGSGGSGAGGNNVAVRIGCYRNGAFVLFGTYFTGSSFAAMWPVFTNTPLVYQCAERVDVQPTIISCGNSFSSGAAVAYPVAAAFYNDTEALLNLIT